ncbi:hypothetical protein [Aurantivibrio plasticivorans]
MSFILTACGSGGGGSNSPDPAPSPTPTPDPTPEPTPTPTETFLGNLTGIEGLAYVSGDVSGITDSNGLFEYENGETLTFRIGDIVIGQASGADTLTLASFAETDVIETNITRFLEVLDDDDNTDNGILIIEAVRDLAVGETIDFDQTATAFVDDGNVQTVVSILTSVTSAGTRMIETDVEPTPDPTPTPTPDNALDLSGEDTAIIGTEISFNQLAYGSDPTTHSFTALLNGNEASMTVVQTKLVETDGASIAFQIRSGAEIYSYNTSSACNAVTPDPSCGAVSIDVDARTISFTDVLIERPACTLSSRECERLGLSDEVIELIIDGTLVWSEDDES